MISTKISKTITVNYLNKLIVLKYSHCLKEVVKVKWCNVENN